MFNVKNTDFFSTSHIEEKMKFGYEEMGALNATLSEEGFAQDMENLESYEKILVESE